MVDKKTEETSTGTKCLEWAKVLAAFVPAVITVIFAYYVSGIMTKQIESQKTVSEYIKIIGDEKIPPYTKALALSSMLRSKLVGADFLFTAGYKIQSETERDVLKDFFYEYGHSKEDPIPVPIGYIGKLTYKKKDRTLTICDAWAIDNETSTAEMAILVWLDDTPLNNTPGAVENKEIPRSDIKKIFINYKRLSEKTGFRLQYKIPQSKIGKKPRLRIKLRNQKLLFMEILDIKVNFQKDFSRVLF